MHCQGSTLSSELCTLSKSWWVSNKATQNKKYPWNYHISINKWSLKANTCCYCLRHNLQIPEDRTGYFHSTGCDILSLVSLWGISQAVYREFSGLSWRKLVNQAKEFSVRLSGIFKNYQVYNFNAGEQINFSKFYRGSYFLFPNVSLI